MALLGYRPFSGLFWDVGYCVLKTIHFCRVKTGHLAFLSMLRLYYYDYRDSVER
jgi:hypothetical protein